MTAIQTRWVLLLVVLIGLIALGVRLSRTKQASRTTGPVQSETSEQTNAVKEPSTIVVTPGEVPSAPLSADEHLKRQLVGFWFHEESGEHWIENRADGTAKLQLKLDFVASLLYGQNTTMDLTWDVKDGILSHTVVSGSPQENVDRLLKAYGQTRSYEVLETTDQHMLLKSKSDPDKKDLWLRKQPPQDWQPQSPSAKEPPKADDLDVPSK